MDQDKGSKFPVMRYVEPIPVEIEGRQMYYVRDPLEVADTPLGLSPAHLYLIGLFDGLHSISDIEEHYEEAAGEPARPGLIEELVETLDEHYYLDSPRFREHFKKLQDEFLQADVRPAWHAGDSYPKDPDELRETLDGFYDEAEPDGEALPGELSAILAPHIDLRVGGTCYPHAFDYTRASDADVFIILGVDHYGEGVPMNACSMDFETPLGRVETDRDLLAAWNEQHPDDLTQHQWSHRTEHSVEFALIFLQHAVQRPFKILPVLCGPIEPHLETGIQPGRELLEGLRDALAEQGKRAVFVLSVDLAHMGPKFSHQFDVDDQMLEQIEEADRAMLQCVAEMNAGAFFEGLEADKNSRHVDAPMAVLSWMALDDAQEGKLLDYGQNFQPDARSMVSYASMVFWR